MGFYDNLIDLEKFDHGSTKSHKLDLYTVEHVVKDALFTRQEDESLFEYYLHFALEVLRELTFDVAHQVKTVKLTMTPWKSIHFPDDYIDWVRVGIQDGNIIKTFVNYPPDVARYHDLDDDGNKIENKKTDTPDPQVVAYPFVSYYNDKGEFEGHLFGNRVHQLHRGMFSVLPETREIQFKVENVDQDQKIYLEYISDGFDPNEKTLINPYLFRLVKLYVIWQVKENNDRYGLSEKERAKRQYEDELDKGMWRMNDLSLDGVYEAVMRGYGRYVKS